MTSIARTRDGKNLPTWDMDTNGTLVLRASVGSTKILGRIVRTPNGWVARTIVSQSDEREVSCNLVGSRSSVRRAAAAALVERVLTEASDRVLLLSKFDAYEPDLSDGDNALEQVARLAAILSRNRPNGSGPSRVLKRSEGRRGTFPDARPNFKRRNPHDEQR